MSAMTPIVILVGSMTGNAEFAAEDMQQILRDEYGRQVELLLMDKPDASIFAPGKVYLISTSTYGEGEVPENALGFYRGLCEGRPDLSGIRYAVFGLGDSNYRETFNFGGKRFDEILAALGASRMGERGLHDACSGAAPEEFARDWLHAWFASVRATID